MYTVTLVMLVINIIIFIATNITDIKLLEYYLVPAYLTDAPPRFVMTLLTSIFIHLDYLHITFNSIALLFLGRIIEPYMGSYRFLLVYLSSGIAGGLLHAIYSFLIDNDIYTPVIGASGSISGVIGVAAASGDRLALFWLLTQIPLALFSGIESIAFFAHIGGFVMGYSIGKFMNISRYDRYNF
jgi:membrane associated rhomboid family serine protease